MFNTNLILATILLVTTVGCADSGVLEVKILGQQNSQTSNSTPNPSPSSTPSPMPAPMPASAPAPTPTPTPPPPPTPLIAGTFNSTVFGGDSVTIPVTGGTPPYNFSIISGAGVINSSGVYTAPQFSSRPTIRVTDSKSQSIQINLKAMVLHYLGGTANGSSNSNSVWSSHDGVTWVEESPLPVATHSFAVEVLDDMLYILGGTTTSITSSTFKASSLSSGWTAGANLPRVASMSGHTVANGKIYLAALTNTFTTSNVANISNIGNLPIAPYELGASAMIYANNKFWLAGGQNWSTEEYHNNIWTSNDAVSWSSVGALPETRAAGAFFTTNNTFYYVGGQSTGNITKNTIFKSSDGITWTTAGTLPVPRDFISVVNYKNKLWLLGGCENWNAGTNVWTSTNATTWTNVGNLPAPRCDGGVVVY